jgi:cysteinyl-tRNA synthetase
MAARSSIARIQNTRSMLAERAAEAPPDSQPTRPIAERIEAFERDFGKGLDDDLNISNAMAALFAFAADVNRLEPNASDAAHLLRTLDRADHVTGVLNRDAVRVGLFSTADLTGVGPVAYDPTRLAALFAEEPSVDTMKALAQIRHAARSKRDYATADSIRDHLKKAGVEFADTPEGVRYRLP